MRPVKQAFRGRFRPPFLWALSCLLVATIPSLFQLPVWVTALVMLALAWRAFAPLRMTRPLARTTFQIVCLALTVLGIMVSFPTPWSGDSVLSLLIIALFLKGVEAESRRDLALVVLGSVIAAAVGSLYGDGIINLLQIICTVLLAVATLNVLARKSPAPVTAVRPLRSALHYLAMAMPLAAVLFLLFPRIPGPLWDLGLVFGLPIEFSLERKDRNLGFGLTLESKDIPRMTASNDVVLVAEFHDRMPHKSELYWRGPVFWDFDGEKWHLPPDWDKRANLMRQAIRSPQALAARLQASGDAISYSARVTPHGQRWLYALDVPIKTAPEAFISGDFQLLSIRKVTEEREYQMSAQLGFALNRDLAPEHRQRALRLPATGNPRLIAFGCSLALGQNDERTPPRQIVLTLAETLSQGDYVMDEATPLAPGPNRLDQLFFDQRRGGAEPFATAAIIALRAAGVPARLITGYHRGTIIALTDFLVIKQSNAHAWLEFWDGDSGGWQRFDPKDFVADGTSAQPKAKKAQAPKQPELDPARSERQPDTPQAEKSRSADVAPAFAKVLADWLSALTDGVDKWVIAYNPERQVSLLSTLGLTDHYLRGLLLTMVAAVLGLSGLFLIFRQIPRHLHHDPVLKAYDSFQRSMTRAGCPRHRNECPRHYQLRAAAELPEISAWIRDIMDHYINLRYGHSEPGELRRFRRQIKRFSGLF